MSSSSASACAVYLLFGGDGDIHSFKSRYQGWVVALIADSLKCGYLLSICVYGQVGIVGSYTAGFSFSVRNRGMSSHRLLIVKPSSGVSTMIMCCRWQAACRNASPRLTETLFTGPAKLPSLLHTRA